MKRIIPFLLFTMTGIFLIGFTVPSEFQTYLAQFRVKEPPFAFKSVPDLFEYSDWDDAFDEKTVKSFICSNLNKEYRRSKYLYRRGVKFDYTGNIITLVDKVKNEPGNSIYDNLLSEIVLTVYSKSGLQLSQTVIDKGSDGYFGEFYFANDSTIRSVQATIIDEESVRIRGPKPIWIDYFKYTIHKDGKVSKTTYKPRAKGEYVFRTAETKVAGIIINGKEVSAKNE